MPTPRNQSTYNQALKDPAKAKQKLPRKPQTQAPPANRSQTFAQNQAQNSAKAKQQSKAATAGTVDGLAPAISALEIAAEPSAESKPKKNAKNKQQRSKDATKNHHKDKQHQPKGEESIEQMLYPEMFDSNGNRLPQNAVTNSNSNTNAKPVIRSKAPRPVIDAGLAFAGSSFHESPAAATLPRPVFKKGGSPPSEKAAPASVPSAPAPSAAPAAPTSAQNYAGSPPQVASSYHYGHPRSNMAYNGMPYMPMPNALPPQMPPNGYNLGMHPMFQQQGMYYQRDLSMMAPNAYPQQPMMVPGQVPFAQPSFHR